MKLDYLRLCSRAWDNPGLIWSCLRDNWNWVSHNCVVNSDSMGRHAGNSATVFRKFVRFQDGFQFQDQSQDRFLYETPSPPRLSDGSLRPLGFEAPGLVLVPNNISATWSVLWNAVSRPVLIHEWQPAMEWKKATRYRNVGIRLFNDITALSFFLGCSTRKLEFKKATRICKIPWSLDCRWIV